MQSLPKKQERSPITTIVINDYKIQTFYDSPFPTSKSLITICNKCLKYFETFDELYMHHSRCQIQTGVLMYKSNVEIYKVDPRKELRYCQSLSLLSKLFLYEKQIYFNVAEFDFFVLCRKTPYELIGYFSKERQSVEGYNLSCVMVLPCYQGSGYGRLLIEYSYELSKMERQVAGPEKPLSNFGKISYFAYWRVVILDLLKSNPDLVLSLDEIQICTGIKAEDVMWTFGEMGMLALLDVDLQRLYIPPDVVLGYIKDNKIKLEKVIDPHCIIN
jgi:GNAT superfamily N-acetyltransferase